MVKIKGKVVVKFHISYIIIILLFIAVLVFICFSFSNSSQPIIDLQSSYFDDFYVESGTVHMECLLKIINRSSKDIKFKLVAYSYEDSENGLLADPRMNGYDMEAQTYDLSIKAATTKAYNIDFIGKHFNANIKQDRLLPNKIQILVID